MSTNTSLTLNPGGVNAMYRRLNMMLMQKKFIHGSMFS